MKPRFEKRLAVGMIIAALACLILLPVPIDGLKVIGSIYTGNVSPGQTVIFPMTISLGANDPPMDMVVDVMGFGQSPDKSYVALDPSSDTSPYSARSYISIDNRTFHLDPGASETVDATISVPGDAGPGGRYAIISIHGLPNGTGSTLVVTAINVPVMMTIDSPGITQTGTITGLTTGTIVAGQPLALITSFKNTGNHHYANTINNVQVTDGSGKQVALLSTDPTLYSIIPGNTVNFVVNLNAALSPGTYTMLSNVSLKDGTLLDSKTASFEVNSSYTAPVQETSVALTPKNPAVLASSDGRIAVSFPAGAVISDVTVTLKPFSLDQLPGLPAGTTAGGTCFEIDGLSGLLSKDAMISVNYSSSDLDAAGGDASKLVLARYDQSGSSWTLLPTTVNKDTTTLSATTNQFSTWAVIASSTPGTQTGGQSKGILAPDVTTVFLSLCLTVVIFGAWKRRER
ncbi:hypothetical protein Mboo_0310 [Methanoregula boonei 6A8]|jgi:hypothetical protein|uniref:Uncharacterized protein n=1 Tax=Methanoregula boonei (strain DSM 21154 / JCM 14090 / 6A8) TaxID=456442 RepID=A7I521_METB6|nr:hypothetical protein [Methanoregula boonei]ABS54832.1 hypothetical protein Mboo_0310 [Methanoregula boonei 6A8]